MLFSQRLTPEIVRLMREVESLAKSHGYRLSIVSSKKRRPGLGGWTHFIDETTIEIQVVSEDSNEHFNLVLGEELIHALQNINHFPKLLPKPIYRTAETMELAQKVSTTILDIHAHQELRRHGLSTHVFGLETYEFDSKSYLSTIPPPETDAVQDLIMFRNAILYLRLYYDFFEDPGMPKEPWHHADNWFLRYLPRTRKLGQIFVGIVQKEGVDKASSCKQVLQKIMQYLDQRFIFVILGGPPQKPAYVEELK
jgi:hypothetical protein